MTPNTMDTLDPKSQEALDHEYTHRQGRSNPNNLRDQVSVQQGQTNWPTPTANEDAAGTPNGKMQKMLGNHPQLRSITGESQPGPQDQTNQTSGEESLQSDQTSPPLSRKTLSPIFVEWMMGLPVGYSDANPTIRHSDSRFWEMESFRRWLQQHGY